MPERGCLTRASWTSDGGVVTCTMITRERCAAASAAALLVDGASSAQRSIPGTRFLQSALNRFRSPAVCGTTLVRTSISFCALAAATSRR